MKCMKTTITLLSANKKHVSDKVVVYRLFHVCGCKGQHFAINVSIDNESSICKFGKDRAKAYDIYRKIVKNGVTPCCLSDIAEDFEKDI
ncbi:MAG: hypothetical protein J6S71_05465 [Clostridia bacterium]|nr:hypothetical protein [Clostridia bacterium]